MTAVEWLQYEINFCKEKNGIIELTQSLFDSLIEQAKEMEKQQLIDARDSGIYTALNRFNNELLKENHIVDTNEMVYHVPDVRQMVELSDEDIEKQALSYFNEHHCNVFEYDAFIAGVKWYREQLKKKQ